MFPGLTRQTRIYEELTDLNEGQRAAFDAVVAGKSVFITGPGGTGKSFLLQTLHEKYPIYTGKKLAITALTGCAAVLIGPFAKTLHSWAGIGLGRGDMDLLAQTIAKDKRKGPRWRKTHCLVIDEVSMMTPSLVELLDKVGKLARKCDKPFGGLQVVFVGDFYQLPPVSREVTAFAFESPLWLTIVQQTYFLTDIMRQKDPVFQKILNEARVGDLSQESYEILEGRKTMEWKQREIKPTLLFTRNADVNTINETQLKKLPGEERVFEPTTEVPAGMGADVAQMLTEKLDKDAPYETKLRLKEGAQVMLLRQIFQEQPDEKDRGKIVKSPIHGLVNGSRGIVKEFAADGNPVVKFMNGRTILVRPETWAADEEEDSLKRSQIPLRLAYALTIHKAQGASLDSVIIDVGTNTFESGQAYVALSRVRSLDSLFIYEISKAAFRAHSVVKKFYAGL